MERAQEVMAKIKEMEEELITIKKVDRAAALADVKFKIKFYAITATELRSVIKRRAKSTAAGAATGTVTARRTRTKKAATPTA